MLPCLKEQFSHSPIEGEIRPSRNKRKIDEGPQFSSVLLNCTDCLFCGYNKLLILIWTNGFCKEDLVEAYYQILYENVRFRLLHSNHTTVILLIFSYQQWCTQERQSGMMWQPVGQETFGENHRRWGTLHRGNGTFWTLHVLESSFQKQAKL